MKATRRCWVCTEKKALVLFPRGRGWRKCSACTDAGASRPPQAFKRVCARCNQTFTSASSRALTCGDYCRRRRRVQIDRERAAAARSKRRNMSQAAAHTKT